jgi:hypothetical protein
MWSVYFWLRPNGRAVSLWLVFFPVQASEKLFLLCHYCVVRKLNRGSRVLGNGAEIKGPRPPRGTGGLVAGFWRPRCCSRVFQRFESLGEQGPEALRQLAVSRRPLRQDSST